MKTPHFDSTGYDCEGYGKTTGIHKNLGTRRYFRAGIDTPITSEEQQLAENWAAECLKRDAQERACFESAPATEARPWGGHQLEPVSHEEDRCVRCGAHFFCPDV